jgi:ligand-binding SRPBCC domain-containing protein
MPTFESTMFIPRPFAEVFDFFARPANLLVVSPPQLHMRLVEAPERLELGSRLVITGRRWGVPHRVVSEVTAFENEVLFRDEQREGPLARWAHTHRFEPVPGGTRVTDHIEFEPPGGLLGRLVTVRFIERELEWVFAYRMEKLKELFGAGAKNH